MQHEIVCKNCGTHFTGNFCNWCGQKETVKRIDATYFLHDVPHSIFHVDKGFLYTLKLMFTNPGFAIKEYLAGKRIKHFRPFAFVVILSTICTILIPSIELLTKHIFELKNVGYKIEVRQLFWERYFSLLIFILIPILSLVTWLSFKKRAYNYWEHFLGNTYLAAMVNFIYLAIKILGLIKVALGMKYGVNFTLFMFGFMFYYSYAFKVWMHPRKNFWSLFFTLLVMNFFLSTIYMTAFSLTGIMSPWWGK